MARRAQVQTQSTDDPIRQFVALGEQAEELARRSQDRKSLSSEEFERERKAILKLMKKLETTADQAIAAADYDNGLERYLLDYGKASYKLLSGLHSERLAGRYAWEGMPEYVSWKAARRGIELALRGIETPRESSRDNEDEEPDKRKPGDSAKKGPGRPHKATPEADQKMYDDRKASGLTEKEFAEQRGLPYAKVEAACKRHRTRRASDKGKEASRRSK
jgi:hypothetical protein